MEIRAEDFLSDDQREEIGNRIFKKLIKSINDIKFEDTININEIFDYYDVASYIDMNEIGDVLTKQFIKKLKG